MRHPRRKACCNFTRTADHLFQIDLYLACHLNPEIGHMCQIMAHFCGTEQGFGRDTAPIQADTAQMLTLDNRYRFSQLAGPNSRHIAAWPAADHHNIKRFHLHRFTPFSLIKVCLSRACLQQHCHRVFNCPFKGLQPFCPNRAIHNTVIS